MSNCVDLRATMRIEDAHLTVTKQYLCHDNAIVTNLVNAYSNHTTVVGGKVTSNSLYRGLVRTKLVNQEVVPLGHTETRYFIIDGRGLDPCGNIVTHLGICGELNDFTEKVAPPINLGNAGDGKTYVLGDGRKVYDLYKTGVKHYLPPTTDAPAQVFDVYAGKIEDDSSNNRYRFFTRCGQYIGLKGTLSEIRIMELLED